MSCQVILTILIIAAPNYAYHTKKSNEVTNSVYRNKRQEERWVWGTDDNNVDDRLMHNTTVIPDIPDIPDAPHQPSPCDPYVPQKPDFTEGHRISEAKCFEYIWELKNRAEEIERADDCEKELGHGNGLPPRPIIGGITTLPGEFPHMGALGWRAVVGTWIFKCGSSLISHKFLVTAAHCSKVSSGDTSVVNTYPEIVRLGDKNIIDTFANGQNPKDVKISRFIVHPEYKPPKKYFDIALIEMEERVTFDKYIQPACLWSNPDTSLLGTRASLSGWGVVDAASQKTSPELQAAYVDIIDSDACNEYLRPVFNRHFSGIQPNQLCAGVLAGGVDSCQGDSGGPLQVKIDLPVKTQGTMSYLIGVTSFGFGCARANTPGVYTRVSSFVDWIESIVWQ